MQKKSKKKQTSKPLTQEDCKLIVTREEFEESVKKLIDEGNALNNTRLILNDGYKLWLYKIENNLRVSFDHPECYLQEYDLLGGAGFFTSNMDIEKELHDDLTIILSFLESLMDRLHSMPSLVVSEKS